MLEDMEQRRDIFLDARIEELLDDLIAAELRDVGDQQLPDLVAKFRQMCSDSRRNCGDLLGDGVAPALHPAIIAGA